MHDQNIIILAISTNLLRLLIHLLSGSIDELPKRIYIFCFSSVLMSLRSIAQFIFILRPSQPYQVGKYSGDNSVEFIIKVHEQEQWGHFSGQGKSTIGHVHLVLPRGQDQGHFPPGVRHQLQARAYEQESPPQCTSEVK